MKLFYCFFVIILLFSSCKTNPPASPFTNKIVSGKIFLNIDFNLTPQNKTVNKTVLLEDFANVSCIPCVTSNKIIENLTRVTYGHSNLIAIKFPTYFPAPNDPFYIANKPHSDSRISFYNVFFAPTTIIDGNLSPSSLDSNILKQRIDARLATTPNFEILVNDEFIEGSYFINVEVNLLAPGIDLTNLVIHAILLESEIEFSSAPGSSNETKFYDVMRSMLLSGEGASLSDVQQSGSTNIEVEADLFEFWNVEKLNTVVFIQNKLSKEVFQAGSTL